MGEQIGAEFQLFKKSLVIRPEKELDHHNASYIKEQADKIMDNYPVHNVVFDFSRSEFMDSSGIGVILGRYKRVTYMGGKVFVTGIGKNLERVFQMSGLYKVVERYETVKEALEIL